ncbi:hypothetical protein EJB05_22823 [Eragrostis curvula]|uniref:Uncharacterized protein n=1 Tax=Eragrostis curvula TaxID=38414 RepID=A0A5J9T4I0_9POAL|nr:hypothetical protein EJB05_53777 [Eragrostis curvula]TVU01360.1 hypothetical protein EJB05_53186 [Eragrostis curvula]TVU06136.1 hypothetical protein EJB05_49331 [Eragrostis curvula]TVU06137.1 hypothetical protein EJB05_49332 [Eragrostis curvula]TVU31151.1 hypothetical protein EJB05_22823 [Eragrostis curvula]
MGPLPASLSSSPRKLLDRNSSKLNAVVQRDIKSSLLLLLVLSTVLVLSVLYSSQADQTGAQSGGIQVEEKCDMSMGKWVRDPRGPLYTNLTCPTLPDSKNCQKYGKDPGHLFWRWQPDGCDLPRFSPERFLDVVRGKRLAFIGDSLARNQMESLLCLLSQAETPTLVDRDALDKFVTWHFPVHNFTLMVMWTEFYAHAVPVPDTNGKPPIPFDIHLDRIVNANWTIRLPGLDYAILSGGNWFFRVNYLWEDGHRIGCVNCREANLTDFGIVYAIRRVVKAALQAIAVCKDCKSNLVTFLRTYTPGHHEHGSWSSGGYCNRTRPLKEEEISLVSIEWELRNAQDEEVRAARETTGSKRFGVLDVTKAMMLRADGHIGAHKDKRWVNASDCLHWCLPGPIDMWNDMLLQRLTEDSPPVV